MELVQCHEWGEASLCKQRQSGSQVVLCVLSTESLYTCFCHYFKHPHFYFNTKRGAGEVLRCHLLWELCFSSLGLCLSVYAASNKAMLTASAVPPCCFWEQLLSTPKWMEMERKGFHTSCFRANDKIHTLSNWLFTRGSFPWVMVPATSNKKYPFSCSCPLHPKSLTHSQ